MPVILPCFALASLAGFILITISVHLLRPDLDVVRNQMSLYLIGPWGHLLQSGYCLLSLGMLALVFGLHGSLQPRARSVVPLLLFGVAAVALCVTAYAWMDMPGVPVTMQGRLHRHAATTTFLAAAIGVNWQAMAFRLDRSWRPHMVWALPWAMLCFLSLSLLGLCPESMIGLGQKSVIVVILGWLGAVSLCQLRLVRLQETAER
ncbi:DUF998 domain-containing protein [Pseudoxanthomonas sp.]|uniref:DUF998 domain-containing protein n=1 Tax=Pseudoxanthomonas sp. TaxID=1871049 RepID=UPI002606D2B0|nr:DUF998 domain-containing protein [Pseudoxanthomonas sp.]WDS35542.1 MAG: DUF998 domain-containing protein [Pseudoxanthomonas sp.]